MKLSKLLLYVGVAVLIFWVVGLFLRVTFFFIHLALVVGLTLIVLSLVGQYIATKGQK